MFKIYGALLIFIVLFSSSLQQPLFLKKLFEPVSYNQNNYHHNNGYHQHQHSERSYHHNNRPARKESDGAKRYREICRINNGFSACPY